MDRRPLALVAGIALLLGGGLLLLQSGAIAGLLSPGEYDEGTVTVLGNDSGAGTATATAGATATATETERPTVAVEEVNGETPIAATVEVRIADTRTKRFIGLSETASLAPDEGMLFVHDETARHAYVMRNMSFPLDIIFIDANGTITTIHHAPVPSEGTSEGALTRYEGRGLYVLEVNRGWANRTGVTVGDQVRLPESVA